MPMLGEERDLGATHVMIPKDSVTGFSRSPGGRQNNQAVKRTRKVICSMERTDMSFSRWDRQLS